MNEFLIREYIERIRKEDINAFAVKQGITLNDNELNIIHEYLKNHWRTFYYGNPKELLEELKQKLSFETYNKLEMLYMQAKNKLNN
jgi:hypothetical protein